MATLVGKNRAAYEVIIAHAVLEEQIRDQESSKDIITYEVNPSDCAVPDLVAKFGPARTLSYLEVEERTNVARDAVKAAFDHLEPTMDAAQRQATLMTVDLATARFGPGRCSEFATKGAVALRDAGIESDIVIVEARNPTNTDHNHLFDIFGEGVADIFRQKITQDVRELLALLKTGWVYDRLLKCVTAASEFSASQEFSYFTLYGITRIFRYDIFPRDEKRVLRDYFAQESLRIHTCALTFVPKIQASRASSSKLGIHGPVLSASILQKCIPGTTWTYPKFSCQVAGTTAWSIAQYLKAHGLVVKLPKVMKPGANSLEIDKPDYARIAKLPTYEEYQRAAHRMIMEVTAPLVEAGRAALIAEYF